MQRNEFEHLKFEDIHPLIKHSNAATLHKLITHSIMHLIKHSNATTLHVLLKHSLARIAKNKTSHNNVKFVLK